MLRLGLMLRQADTTDAPNGLPHCELVAKGGGRGYLYVGHGTFRSDRVSEPLLTDADLRTLARRPKNEMTFTCVPPGSGVRIWASIATRTASSMATSRTTHMLGASRYAARHEGLTSAQGSTPRHLRMADGAPLRVEANRNRPWASPWLGRAPPLLWVRPTSTGSSVGGPVGGRVLQMALTASISDFPFVTTGACEMHEWRISPLRTPPAAAMPDA